MKRYKLAVCKKILREAAEEAWQNEVIDTLNYHNIIGKGKEYADKKDWIETKLAEWEEEALK